MTAPVKRTSRKKVPPPLRARARGQRGHVIRIVKVLRNVVFRVREGVVIASVERMHHRRLCGGPQYTLDSKKCTIGRNVIMVFKQESRPTERTSSSPRTITKRKRYRVNVTMIIQNNKNDMPAEEENLLRFRKIGSLIFDNGSTQVVRPYDIPALAMQGIFRGLFNYNITVEDLFNMNSIFESLDPDPDEDPTMFR